MIAAHLRRAPVLPAFLVVPASLVLPAFLVVPASFVLPAFLVLPASLVMPAKAGISFGAPTRAARWPRPMTA